MKAIREFLSDAFGITVALIVMAFALAMVWMGIDIHREHQRWQRFSDEHNCAITDVGVGHDDKTVYICDNGVRYWR